MYMASNKVFLWIAAVLITSALCAFSAVAEVRRPEAYERLTAVQLKPGNAPRTIHGMDDLSLSESRHSEHLPMQLDGPSKKIKRAKYTPKAGKKSRKKGRRS